MVAVQEEDRLAAAEAGTAGPNAAEQKANIKNALNNPVGVNDIVVLVTILSKSLVTVNHLLQCCRYNHSQPFIPFDTHQMIHMTDHQTDISFVINNPADPDVFAAVITALQLVMADCNVVISLTF